MDIPYNELNREQNKKLIPAQVKKGIISAVHLESWTADVQVVGSVQTILKNVPITLGLSSQDVKVGDKCKIETFDETNPNDMVVAFTYGRAKYKRANSGFVTMTYNGSEQSIPHGLGVTPDVVSLSPTNYGVSVVVPMVGVVTGAVVNVRITSPADDTYIYATAESTPTGTSPTSTTVFWSAAKID